MSVSYNQVMYLHRSSTQLFYPTLVVKWIVFVVVTDLGAGESHSCNQSNRQAEFASSIWGSYQLIMPWWGDLETHYYALARGGSYGYIFCLLNPALLVFKCNLLMLLWILEFVLWQVAMNVNKGKICYVKLKISNSIVNLIGDANSCLLFSHLPEIYTQVNVN